MPNHNTTQRTPLVSASAGAADFAGARKLRTPEAARFVGLAPSTLSKLRCVGGGPKFTRLGRAIVYTVDDLEAWVASHGKCSSTADDPVLDQP